MLDGIPPIRASNLPRIRATRRASGPNNVTKDHSRVRQRTVVVAAASPFAVPWFCQKSDCIEPCEPTMNIAHSRLRTSARADRGFSLIELLVVIAIIGLIISIVVPGVASARKSARQADSLNLANGLSQSCSQFILDERRAPGYFSGRDMGSTENIGRGFTQMENAILDLCGGIVPAGQASEASDLTSVGPTNAGAVRVRPTLIGTAAKSYFPIKSKYFKKQDGQDGDAGNRKSTGDNRDMPVLVDAEGCPLLMWVSDDTARKEIRAVADLNEFCRESSDSSPSPARFYWASNSAFLGGNVNSATDPELFVGRRRVNQSTGSIIGFGSAARAGNLAALLGNPNSPAPYSSSATPDQIVPTAGRGTVIIHSAGRDATYFGRADKGAKRRTGGNLFFGDSFVPGPTEDLVGNFDDIFVAGN